MECPYFFVKKLAQANVKSYNVGKYDWRRKEYMKVDYKNRMPKGMVMGFGCAAFPGKQGNYDFGPRTIASDESTCVTGSELVIGCGHLLI